jgi:hypothetical protein
MTSVDEVTGDDVIAARRKQSSLLPDRRIWSKRWLLKNISVRILSFNKNCDFALRIDIMMFERQRKLTLL